MAAVLDAVVATHGPWIWREVLVIAIAMEATARAQGMGMPPQGHRATGERVIRPPIGATLDLYNPVEAYCVHVLSAYKQPSLSIVVDLPYIRNRTCIFPAESEISLEFEAEDERQKDKEEEEEQKEDHSGCPTR
jgi:hypothetical protein